MRIWKDPGKTQFMVPMALLTESAVKTGFFSNLRKSNMIPHRIYIIDNPQR